MAFHRLGMDTHWAVLGSDWAPLLRQENLERSKETCIRSFLILLLIIIALVASELIMLCLYNDNKDILRSIVSKLNNLTAHTELYHQRAAFQYFMMDVVSQDLKKKVFLHR